MKRIFYILTLGALATACTDTFEDQEVKQIIVNQPVAISFDTYVTQNAETRAAIVTPLGTAGSTGSIETVDRLRQVGFGVFGYYSSGTGSTDGGYAATSAPNFMYDQKLVYNGTKWTYNPLKYWPNETSDDAHGATERHTDKLSFFAYAPYIGYPAGTDPDNHITPTDNSATHWGIVQLADNFSPKDPKLVYAPATISPQSVDLLWGVAPTGGLQYTSVNGSTVKVNEGMPLTNLVKPSTTQQMKFHFKHALARLDIQVAADMSNPAGPVNEDNVKTNTVITIDKMTITGNFARQATLNLNNTTAGSPRWESPLYDLDENGQSTGKHTYTIDEQSITESLRFPDHGFVWTGSNGENVGTYSEEFQKLLDDNLIGYSQNGGFKHLLKHVKPLAQDGTTELSSTDEQTYLMMIPEDNHLTTDLTVSITYQVTHINKNLVLERGYHRIDQTVTKDISIPAPGIEAGKSYVLKCLIGLNDVQLKIDTYDWAEPVTFSAPDVENWETNPRSIEVQASDRYKTLWVLEKYAYTGQLPQSHYTDVRRKDLQQKVQHIYNKLAVDGESALKLKVNVSSANWSLRQSYLQEDGSTQEAANVAGGTSSGQYDVSSGYIYIYIPTDKAFYRGFATLTPDWLFLDGQVQDAEVESIEFVPSTTVCGAEGSRSVTILSADDATPITKI